MTDENEHEMTPADATAVGAAGARRIDPETQSPEEARVVAREDMAREAKRLDLQMSPESINQIADTFIDKLTAMGAFRRESDETEETPENTDTAASTGESAASTSNPEPTDKSKLATWLGL